MEMVLLLAIISFANIEHQADAGSICHGAEAGFYVQAQVIIYVKRF